MIYLWLAVGGALGTLSRYTVSGWVVQRFGPSPWGTFTVNITGAFVIGFFLTLAESRLMISPNVRALIAVGFLGGYTTFSTLSWETMGLLQDGALASALLNGFGSVLAGLVAVYAGIALARLV